MVVCKIGGPAYRIGMGGGAASSRYCTEYVLADSVLQTSESIQHKWNLSV